MEIIPIKNTHTFLVVIGASAGGFTAIERLVTQFKPDTNAAYCIIVHLSNSEMQPFLVNRLQPLTSLPCIIADEGVVIEKGKIYVAQPGRHLLVKDGKMLLGYGPEENNFRPAIDILFRSAAAAYHGRTIGIILTGLLQDGTSGMEAIKLCGGTLIVQDPEEAEYPNMPLSVIRNMKVDFSLSLDDIGEAIIDVVENKIIEEAHIPQTIVADTRRSEKMAVGVGGMEEFGERSEYGCPDCGGVLWKEKSEGQVYRYRCHVGHAYVEDDLLQKQVKVAESSIWIAVRIMEERKHLLVKRIEEYKNGGFFKLAENFNNKLEDIKKHIEQLKAVLVAIETNQPDIENTNITLGRIA